MPKPAIFSLDNEYLHVEISAKGAELQSVIARGVERLWEGNPAVWGRKAPVLFPFIGRLRNNTYELNGQAIEAPMHGFCRDRLFSGERINNQTLQFSTCSDADTYKVYPFNFEFSITYSLEENTLSKTHTVRNKSEIAMPFEVGGHEAYATQLSPGETMADYYIKFDEICDSLEMFGIDESGILQLPKISIPLDKGRLTKTPEQLSIDTIVLENIPHSRVTLAATTNDYTTTVAFSDFPYLGIWTASGQTDPRYICMEPWSALPDGHFAPKELTQKPGVKIVEPGQTASLTYTMTFS